MHSQIAARDKGTPPARAARKATGLVTPVGRVAERGRRAPSHAGRRLVMCGASDMATATLPLVIGNSRRQLKEVAYDGRQGNGRIGGHTSQVPHTGGGREQPRRARAIWGTVRARRGL